MLPGVVNPLHMTNTVCTGERSYTNIWATGSLRYLWVPAGTGSPATAYMVCMDHPLWMDQCMLCSFSAWVTWFSIFIMCYTESSLVGMLAFVCVYTCTNVHVSWSVYKELITAEDRPTWWYHLSSNSCPCKSACILELPYHWMNMQLKFKNARKPAWLRNVYRIRRAMDIDISFVLTYR